jgi:hypothetical protein
MAAIVVRDFILPMFESDGRKLLRRKSKSGVSSPGSTQTLAKDFGGASNTVFQELKLSTFLNSELTKFKEAIDLKKLELEETGNLLRLAAKKEKEQKQEFVKYKA